jgi:hypothetical protein
MRNSGAYAVALDLFGLDTLGALAEQMTASLIANRPSIRQVLPKLRGVGRSVLRGAAATLSARIKAEFGQEVEIGFTPGLAERDPERYFDWALRLLQRVAEADGRPVLLYVDEFQEIAASGQRFGDPDLLMKKMRSVLQRSDRVTCLFAGSIEHMMAGLFATRHRAFYQFGGFFDMGDIARDDWRSGLLERFEKDHCTASTPALDLLLHCSEGHSRATMLLAQQAHVVVVEQGSFGVGLAEIHEGVGYAMSQESATHESELMRIRSSGRHALRVAQRVARQEAPYATDLDAQQVARSLDALRSLGMVTKGGRGAWRIVDPLFGRYLREFHGQGV